MMSGVEGFSVMIANLRRERDSLREQLERFHCFKCSDGHTPLYCLNCADVLLRNETNALHSELERMKEDRNRQGMLVRSEFLPKLQALEKERDALKRDYEQCLNIIASMAEERDKLTGQLKAAKAELSKIAALVDTTDEALKHTPPADLALSERVTGQFAGMLCAYLKLLNRTETGQTRVTPVKEG